VARFSAPVQTGSGVHPASYTTGTGSFPEIKQPGRGFDHPPPSNPLWAFVACSRVNFNFIFTFTTWFFFQIVFSAVFVYITLSFDVHDRLK